jgi:hypothetical protein
MRRAIEIVVSAILGAIVASVGAIAHRSYPPVGLILSALLVLAAIVFVRAWGSWGAVLAFAIPFVALTFVFARQGPGGDLLIAGDSLGYAWLIASTVAVLIACVLPARLLGGARQAAPAEGEAGRVSGP